MWYRKMQKKAGQFFKINVILCAIFAYQLLMNMIPGSIHITQSNLEHLTFGLPIQLECEDTGKAFIDTAVLKPADQTQQMPEDVVTNHTVTLTARLFGIIPVKQVEADLVEAESVYVSGETVGLYVQSDGILVIGNGNFEGIDNQVHAPAQNVLKSGDYICAVNGTSVEKKENLIDMIAMSEGHQVILSVRRKAELIDLYIQPAMDSDGIYRIGAWVRDDLAGIGTLTYVKEDRSYAALGHSIADVDIGSAIEISTGNLYNSKVVGVQKGEDGKPGELKGTINYDSSYCMGKINSNTVHGVYGVLSEENNLMEHCQLYPIGYKQEIQIAPACILGDVDGTIQCYNIYITEVNYHESKENKSILFKVDDDTLLAQTGGIVQGMSGSPIIQNGRIIGAVTHVFVNDPTKGYGIFIEDMLAAE